MRERLYSDADIELVQRDIDEVDAGRLLGYQNYCTDEADVRDILLEKKILRIKLKHD